MKGFWGVFSLIPSVDIAVELEVTIQNLRGQLQQNNFYRAEGLICSTLNSKQAVLKDPANQVICSGWVRLDNYIELCLELNLKKNTDDLNVVLAAYLKWGERLLEHLLGDFSFFIYQIHSQQLFLAKDQLGIRPLFYSEYEGNLLFSTQIDVIKKLLPEKPELNVNYIVKELKNYPQEVEDTFFKSIHRLKPAHFIVIEKGEKLHEKRYWNLTAIELPKFKNPEEYYELVRSSLIKSVESRIRGKRIAGCQLSGGIDSSVIAVILSRVFPKEKLHTYSFVLNEKTAAFSDSRIDEKGTQEEVIQYADLIRENHHPITDFHFKDVFEELQTRNQVMGGWANSDAIWQDSLFKSAAENQGVEVMFSGFLGDEGVSCSGGNYFYDYIHHKDLKGILSHVWRFRLSGLKGIYGYFRLKKLGTAKPEYVNIQRKRSLLNPAREKDFKMQDSSFAFKPSFKEWLRSQITRPHTCLRTESEGCYANRYGIDMVYPLADLRLIQLVYSLPVNLFAPKPYSRALFRNVGKGIIPDLVRIQPKFSGASALAFAEFWIKNKHEQLRDYQIKDALNIFISEEEYFSREPENEVIAIKRLNILKEIDFLKEINR